MDFAWRVSLDPLCLGFELSRYAWTLPGPVLNGLCLAGFPGVVRFSGLADARPQESWARTCDVPTVSLQLAPPISSLFRNSWLPIEVPKVNCCDWQHLRNSGPRACESQVAMRLQY